MNKKVLFGMFAAATMLCATSCSNEDLDGGLSGTKGQVAFSLGLEGGIDTRAISDGTGADVLVYAVFDKDGNRLSDIEAVTKTGVTFPATESITLAKGQTYKVAFWAQDADCEAYTVDTDNMSIAVNYEGANNDETRDAFFKTVEFTVSGSSTTIDVELKRPFAQVNVGVTKADWDAAIASGIEIGNSAVVIKNAATSLNLLDGTVGEETVEVSYALSTIPGETLQVDTDGDDVKEDFYWLSMSYILPADNTTGYNKTTLESTSFTFAPKNAAYNSIQFNQGLNSVPVQRNWRTNILGKLLTGDINFNITIDPIYENENNEDSWSPEGIFKTELANSNVPVVTPIENLDFGTSALNVNRNVTIDMNNKEVLAGGVDTKNYAFQVYNSKAEFVNANIKNGGIGASNAEVVFYNGQNHISNSLTSRYVFYAEENSKIVIKDGEFSVNKPKNKYVCANNNSTVYIEGGTWGTNGIAPSSPVYVGEGSKVVITGGTFNFDPTAYVPVLGYSIEQNGNTWTVTAVSEITFTESVNLGTSALNVYNDIAINMNNYEFTAGGVDTRNYAFQVYGSKLVLTNANIKNGGVGADNGAEVVFYNGQNHISNSLTSRYVFYAGSDSKIVIKDGEFSVNKPRNKYICAYENSEVYVEGGTWGTNGIVSSSPIYVGEGSKVVITGGTFNFDPTKYVPAGYKAEQNGNQWTVSAE